MHKLLKEHKSTDTKSTWTDVFTVIRNMTRAQRMEMLRVGLAPWPNVSDNISMWIWLITLVIGQSILAIVIVGATRDANISYWPIISFFVWYLVLGSWIGSFTSALQRGIAARKADRIADMMVDLQDKIKELGDSLLDRLKKTSGRTHIDDNPISRAAAALDAADRAKNNNEVRNPLRAALNDSLTPNDLRRREDTDENPFQR